MPTVSRTPADVTGVPRIERPPTPLPDPRTVLRDSAGVYVMNGLVGLIFSASGPVAVILAAGSAGDLGTAVLSSWLFGVFVLNGLLTILMSWVYRTPLAFAWTIPGTVLVAASLREVSWPEILGAFLVTGVVITLVGATGRVRQLMAAVPEPIVMAMVAGVFLQFGVDVVTAVREDPVIAAPIVVVFVVFSARLGVLRRVPPIVAALGAGVLVIALSGRFAFTGEEASVIARPVLTMPEFSVRALTELVVPLVITVIAVQNAQGLAILRAAGHRPPVNVITIVSGIWSMAAASVGAVSSCLAGPTNALLVAGGERRRQYVSALTYGVLAILVGVFAPAFVAVMRAAPAAFVATIGGLALLGALRGAFTTAFGGRFTLGALVTFLIAVSGVSVANIGAPFWGLVVGVVVSRLVDREDWSSTTDNAQEATTHPQRA